VCSIRVEIFTLLCILSRPTYGLDKILRCRLVKIYPAVYYTPKCQIRYIYKCIKYLALELNNRVRRDVYKFWSRKKFELAAILYSISKVGSQKSEVRSRNSEVGTQKSELRSRKSEESVACLLLFFFLLLGNFFTYFTF